MKTFIDKLRETPLKHLKEMIEKQKTEINIMKRDLKRMERVLVERSHNNTIHKDGWSISF